MEQKTCTIRVVNRDTQVRGVLFIKEGELFDARIKDRQGKEAAFEILSWEKVTLSIQDTCVLKENRIQIGLQAILFDAMRLKDESLAGDVPMEEMESLEADNERISENLSRVEKIRGRISDLLRGRPGLESVEVTTEWDHLTAIASELGNAIAVDELKACFIDSGEKIQTIILPGDETIEVRLNSQFPREIIRNVLYE